MANREKAIREAYFSVLNNQLTYNTVAVPISDLKLETDASLYVLFAEQSGRNNDTLAYYAWDSLLTLTIVHKQFSSVSRDILDDVSQQIEDIIIGSIPTYKGLQEQTGWQIQSVRLDSTNYQRWEPTLTSSPVVKTLTFYQLMVKL